LRPSLAIVEAIASRDAEAAQAAMAAQTFVSSNPFVTWLRQLEQLWRAA